MSNSPLVVYTKISPNKTVNRKYAITRITPHCVVGQCSAESLGEIFAPTSRQASSNYGIDKDARVGMYCEEKDRSWCSSSSDNDNRAITIECASDAFHPYAFKDIVYEKLIELCVDICKRNGKNKLIWINDKNSALSYELKSNEMLLTAHRWFAATECPGDWMYSRMDDLANKVTAKLNSNEEGKEEVKPFYRVQTGAYTSLANATAMQRKLKAAGFDTYLVKASDGFYKVQTGAFKDYDNARELIKKLRIMGFDAFITTKTGVPVSDDVEKPKEIILKEGDLVRMQKGAPVYGSNVKFQDWVYKKVLFVRDVVGDRIVVSIVRTGPITGVVDKKYLTKV